MVLKPYLAVKVSQLAVKYIISAHFSLAAISKFCTDDLRSQLSVQKSASRLG